MYDLVYFFQFLIESCAMNYCKDGLQVYFATETQQYTLAPIYGHYELQPYNVNGRPYFKMGSLGFWHEGQGNWRIGNHSSKGQPIGYGYSNNDAFCPNKFSDRDWILHDGSTWYFAGKDLVITCKFINIPNKTVKIHIKIDNFLGNFGNCTDSNLCGEDEGDCDLDSQCKDNHKCGNDNCRSSLGFHSQFDCCYGLGIDFCTTENPCGIDEGDCDLNSVCQDTLVCGLDNCPESLGYDSTTDCCHTLTQLKSPNYPNQYPASTVETWLISAPSRSIINLQFHEFNVRYS